MLNEPIAILAVLLGIEGVVLLLSEYPKTKFLFNVIPSMFWIYFLPMLANTAGLLPHHSETYGTIPKYVLPACLALLLLSTDVLGILRLGPIALAVMLAGSAGIVLGGPIVLAIFHHWLPADIWMGFGSLSASWTGGSANMIAVKEANGTPDKVYSLMVVVDTICPYVWMGLLILLSGFQARYDKWNRSRHAIVDELQKNHVAQAAPQPLSLGMLGILLALAAGTTCASVTLGEKLPTIKGVVNPYAWSIILATGIGLAMSFTPARRLEPFGASRVGYAMLYLVLASIGAKTSLADFELHSVLVLLLAGFVWIGIHAVFIVVAGRLLRAPMSLLAAASQANIGGTASAPVVAAVYHPALATVGLLLAVLGNIIGTYLGLVCTQLCHWVSRLW